MRATGVALVLLLVGIAGAADPPAGTLQRRTRPVVWAGKHFMNAQTASPDACAASDCDEFLLTVSLSSRAWRRAGGVQIGIRWPDESQDLDLYVYDAAGQLVAKSDGFFASTSESVILPSAANGTYRVVVVPRQVTDLVYDGRAEVERFPRVRPVRDLLPDLIALSPRNLRFEIGAYLFDPRSTIDPSLPPPPGASCYPEETTEQGATRCLRFDQTLANLGKGPFELRYRLNGIATDQELRQRIYRSDGTFHERFADTYEFHAAHAHFHYKNFAQSRLWASNASGEKLGTDPVRVGKKNGFCMIDVEDEWFDRKGDAARTYYFPRCNAPSEQDENGSYLVNGISVGWADVYNWYLADQFIEVSGIPDGYYLLETIADPNDTIVERREDNNGVLQLIRLCGDRGEIVGQEPVCGPP